MIFNAPKPPLGIMPKFISDEIRERESDKESYDMKRRIELLDTINRYEVVGRKPLPEWIRELKELNDRLHKG